MVSTSAYSHGLCARRYFLKVLELCPGRKCQKEKQNHPTGQYPDSFCQRNCLCCEGYTSRTGISLRFPPEIGNVPALHRLLVKAGNTHTECYFVHMDQEFGGGLCILSTLFVNYSETPGGLQC